MVEFDLEAISVIAVCRDRGQRGVSLGADCDIGILFAVDNDRAGRVFLVGAGFDKAVPVVRGLNSRRV